MIDENARGLKKGWWFASLWIAVLIRPGAAAPGEEGRVFRASQRDSVAELRLEYWGQAVEIRKSDSLWMLPLQGVAAQKDRVEEALDRLFALRAGEVVSKKQEALAGYGLNPENAWTVALKFANGKSVKLLLGRSADYSGYWKRADGPNVYRQGSPVWSGPADPESWMDHQLLPVFRPRDVRSIQVRWFDSAGAAREYKVLKLSLKKAVLVEPDTLDLTIRKAASLFIQTNQFAFDALPGPEEHPIAVDSPEVTVRLVMDDGTVHELKTAGVSGAYYYVRHPLGGWVKVLRGRFDIFRREVAELTALPVLGPEPDDGMTVPVAPGTGVFRGHCCYDEDSAHEVSGTVESGEPGEK